MSESREPSYYEIALTNTQVLVAFGILLLCVAGAFVSGMWVARESLRDRLEAAETAPPASVAGEGQEQQQTFEFFGEEDGAGQANAAGQADNTAPPLLPPISSQPPAVESNAAERTVDIPEEDDAAEEAKRLAEAAEVEAADARLAASTEEAENSADPDERPATGDAAPSAPSEAREREPSPAPDSATSQSGAPSQDAGEPQPSAGAVVIQVFSSSEEVQANGLIARLRADGFRAFLSPVDVDGRTMYRVRVGPYPSREAAQVDAEKLKRTHRLDTWFPRS